MEALSEILNSRSFLFIAIGSVFIIWILAATIENIVRTRAQERSRREIAAYIAEGTMTPEQGERLMKAGAKKSSCS